MKDTIVKILTDERDSARAELARVREVGMLYVDQLNKAEDRVSALEAALYGVIDKQAHRGTVVLYEEDIDKLRAVVTPSETKGDARAI